MSVTSREGLCPVVQFSRIVQGEGPRHIFGVRSGIVYPWYLSPHITHTRSRNTLILGISMAEKNVDYKSWSLEELRAEAKKRFVLFTQKDGVKTLASKLRAHDKLMSKKADITEEKEDSDETVDEDKASNLTFDQRLQLLQLERQIRMEEREAEREKREYERQIERERREYESQKAREEEERLVRQEERLRNLRCHAYLLSHSYIFLDIFLN